MSSKSMSSLFKPVSMTESTRLTQIILVLGVIAARNSAMSIFQSLEETTAFAAAVGARRGT